MWHIQDLPARLSCRHVFARVCASKKYELQRRQLGGQRWTTECLGKDLRQPSGARAYVCPVVVCGMRHAARSSLCKRKCECSSDSHVGGGGGAGGAGGDSFGNRHGTYEISAFSRSIANKFATAMTAIKNNTTATTVTTAAINDNCDNHMQSKLYNLCDLLWWTQRTDSIIGAGQCCNRLPAS